MRGLFAVFVALLWVGSCGTTEPSPESGAPSEIRRYQLRVIREIPRPPTLVEGLDIDTNGVLYESGGLYGESVIRRLDLSTGAVLDSVALPDEFFAEGVTSVGDELIQLTWNEETALRWTPALERTGEFAYTGEGWGLDYDSDRELVVMSNGSATITLRDPGSFASVRTLDVTREGHPVLQLNELEVVGGQVLANVWQTNRIEFINLESGIIEGEVEVPQLWDNPTGNGDFVLNGIAHRPGDPPDRLYLTGKGYPAIWEVELLGSS